VPFGTFLNHIFLFGVPWIFIFLREDTIMVKHPWHEIPVGSDPPELVNAVIEIPKDSQLKYELDKDSGMLRLDRVLYSSVYYPGDYGFVPQTLWSDGDPLDIIILTGRPVVPMALAEVRPIGVFKMIDGDEEDDKILAVYDCDPRFKEFSDITDVPKHTLSEIKHFFESYKHLQGKECKILDIQNAASARKVIKTAMDIYAEKYLKSAA
jgi:inorganic pyrophosphatase